ncbi:MAG: tRNA uridine-5-carboxymethylaminomethyl(34) synthesis GTPase MnmE, partial [Candidatus Omnitrophica bacterium]|nr:tRNA uridine-5-carboxymethylaminomethyl(34) synthesis GTPase MnmE [Candidatus Omnitrophota bacterium]
MNNTSNDTIAAISTPPGEGGIGIVRLSGKDAFAIADAIFDPASKTKPSSCKTHTVHYGYIAPPDRGERIDEVLLTVMRSPNTYTAEDVVEISCHGGMMPLKRG